MKKRFTLLSKACIVGCMLFAIFFQSHAMASLRKIPKGPVVKDDVLMKGVHLVEFWATWCGNCLENIETLHIFFEKNSPKNLSFTAINIDDDIEDVVAFLDDAKQPAFKSLRTKSLYDENQKFAKKMGVDKLPVVMLLVDGEVKLKWEKKLTSKDLVKLKEALK